MIKYGFNVKDGGRVPKSNSGLLHDRNSYYKMPSAADEGTPEGRETWCIYVLDGILTELKKVDQLTRYAYLQEHVLLPALAYSRQRELLQIQGRSTEQCEEIAREQLARVGLTGFREEVSLAALGRHAASAFDQRVRSVSSRRS